MRLAAENGHLEVVKWLVEESLQYVDVTSRKNYAVRLAAQNGYLNVVKWLVLESGQPVDVTDGYNSALRSSRENDHVEVVNFLTSIIECQNAGIEISRLQLHPQIVELVEKGLDLALIASLSDSDVTELISDSAMWNKKTKLPVIKF